MKKKIGDTIICTVQGDITKVDFVDAIVNSASNSSPGGSGINSVIHKAAGKGLLLEYNKLGGCSMGEATVTMAYKLPCKYVIHTVGPVWKDGNHNECNTLTDCYKNSLRAAVAHPGIESVAFPSISTGVHSYPIEKAAYTAVHAVYDFLTENSGSIKLICWVLFDQKTLDAYDKAIELLNKELKSNDDQNQVPMIGFYHQDEIYGCFSNWYPAEFDYAGRHYANSEQFMMYHKVSMFRKDDLAKQIMSTSNPMECKDIARQEYPEFKTVTWESTCYTIVKRGVKAKFYQNPGIREILLNTGNAILAECSPKDKKWGIGLSLNDPDRKDCSKWNGKNMLGRILMEVREEIRQDMLLNPTAFSAMYKNLYKLTPPVEWESNASALEKIPDFHAAIHAYADTLPTQKQREEFYNACPLDKWEYVINSKNDFLPRAGFFEMKQEVFEIVRLRKRIESKLAMKYK